MAIQELSVTHQEAGNRIANQAYEYAEVNVVAAAATVVTIAPADGKLKRALLTAGTALNATNNYATVLMVNKSNADAAMFGTNDTGDGTDTAQYGKRVLVLTATDADLIVVEGDHLELTTTIDTIPGAASKVTLVYEVD